LDFAFESKNDGHVYIAEMKCELELGNYRFLTLESPTQLDHHTKKAFQLFLETAKNANQHTVTIGGKPQLISGSILVWGRCTKQGRASVIAKYGFHDILSLEDIIVDLKVWRNKDFTELLCKYQIWSNELFSGLREMEKASES